MTVQELKDATYILWQNYGTEGWQPTPFDTLEEALEYQRYCADWIITEPTSYSIVSKKFGFNSALTDASQSLAKLREIRG